MIFVAYSHRDADWCEEVVTMAAPLMRYGGLQSFSDSDIAAGSAWRSTIRKALDKSAAAVLLVSRHALSSKFIMDTELPYILTARKDRGLVLLWILVSDCLFEKTPLEPIQAALPTSAPLEGMSRADRSKALKKLCEKIDTAWRNFERPRLNLALQGRKMQKRVENLQVLSRAATRRTEIFVRPDNQADWYHQGPVLAGEVARTCHFGHPNTKPGTGFHILAITTDSPVPHQGGKPTNPLPKFRTRADGLRVIRG
jgi:hypothetical protein